MSKENKGRILNINKPESRTQEAIDNELSIQKMTQKSLSQNFGRAVLVSVLSLGSAGFINYNQQSKLENIKNPEYVAQECSANFTKQFDLAVKAAPAIGISAGKDAYMTQCSEEMVNMTEVNDTPEILLGGAGVFGLVGIGYGLAARRHRKNNPELDAPKPSDLS